MKTSKINVEECAATYDEWAQDNFYYNSDNHPTINMFDL